VIWDHTKAKAHHVEGLIRPIHLLRDGVRACTGTAPLEGHRLTDTPAEATCRVCRDAPQVSP